MKKFTLLLEELSSYEKEYLRNELGGDEYNPEKSHPEMFDSYQDKQNLNRITLPLETNNLNDKVDSQIKFHLKSHGWDIHNYHAGLASRQSTDREGNDKLEVRKIGKVLQQTGGDKVYHTQLRDRLIKGSDGRPLVGDDGRYKSEQVKQSLSDFYNSDPIRDSSKSEHNIVISRDLDDIGGMTSGRDWEDDSCMRLSNGDYTQRKNGGGRYHRKIKADLENHTLVAYATKRGDDELEDPVGRVLIKKYTGKLPDGTTHDIYRPETKTYGNVPDGFSDQVNELMQKHYPQKPDTHYKLDSNLYNDGRSEIEPIKMGFHKDYDGVKHYNSRGQLHDYVDENGKKYPAVRNKNGDYTHYKNGKLHNENGISHISENGTHIAYHINGEFHRDGDLPAIHSTDGNHEEYYYGGVRHRSGDKPAIIHKDANGYTESYYHAGLLHRDGDKPAIISEVKDRYGKKIKKEEYYKNGILHREGNKPHTIEDINTGSIHYTQLYYNKGGNAETPSNETLYDDGSSIHHYEHDSPDHPIKVEHFNINQPYGKTETFYNKAQKNYDHNGKYINGQWLMGGSVMDADNDGSIKIKQHNNTISYNIFKHKNGDIHFIDHREKRLHVISPNSEHLEYKYEGDKDEAKHNIINDTNLVHIKTIIDTLKTNINHNKNSQIPKQQKDLINELHSKIRYL